ESEDPARCEAIKKLLEPFLRLDQENAVCFRIGLGYFSWPLIIRPGVGLRETGTGLASPSAGVAAVENQLRMTARIVASLLTSYRLSGMKKEILAWQDVLQQLPIAQEPEFVRNWMTQALEFARS